MNIEMPPQNNGDSEANEEINKFGFTKAEWEAMDDMDRMGHEMCAAVEEAQPEVSEIERVPYTKEMAETMEITFLEFESRFPLDQLFAIETKEEALKSLLRESAKAESVYLHELFRYIVEKTDISKEEEKKIEERRKRISMAIGMINSGKVRHD